ncbi:hypothetical protein D3C72_1662980 [compost metagenome]
MVHVVGHAEPAQELGVAPGQARHVMLGVAVVVAHQVGVAAAGGEHQGQPAGGVEAQRVGVAVHQIEAGRVVEAEPLDVHVGAIGKHPAQEPVGPWRQIGPAVGHAGRRARVHHQRGQPGPGALVTPQPAGLEAGTVVGVGHAVGRVGEQELGDDVVATCEVHEAQGADEEGLHDLGFQVDCSALARAVTRAR